MSVRGGALLLLLLWMHVSTPAAGSASQCGATASGFEDGFCDMRRNPIDIRVTPEDPIYDMYGCTTGNYKHDTEVHVISLYYSPTGTVDLKIRHLPRSRDRDLILVLMSQNPIEWTIDAPSSIKSRLNVVHLMSMNLANSDVYSTGDATIKRYHDFLGLGTEKDLLVKLHTLIDSHKMTSFSGTLAASKLKLYVGLNYRCHQRQPNNDACHKKDNGLHADVYSDDCQQFLLCSPSGTFIMRCDGADSGDLHWDTETGRCVDDKECQPAELSILDKAHDSDVRWTSYTFDYDNSWANCTGNQYIRLTKYGYYIGVILCTNSRYKLLLSATRHGKYLDIADSDGDGRDHCEFVGGSEVHASTSPDYWQSPRKEDGYYRAHWGENLARGAIGFGRTLQEWTGNYYPSWYECGVDIPGESPVQPACTITVTKGDDHVTMECHIDGTPRWFVNDDIHGDKGVVQKDSMHWRSSSRYVFKPSVQSYLGVKVTCCDSTGRNCAFQIYRTWCEPQCDNLTSISDPVAVVHTTEMMENCLADTGSNSLYRDGDLVREMLNTPGLYTCIQCGSYQCTAASKYYITNECGRDIRGNETLSKFVVEFVNTAKNEVFCGGVLLTDQWIMSAAHCFKSDDTSQNIPIYSIRVKDSVGKTHEINMNEGIHYPPRNKSFNPQTLENDMALLKLTDQVTMDDGKPICIGRHSLIRSMERDASTLRTSQLLKYSMDRSHRFSPHLLRINTDTFCEKENFHPYSAFCASSMSTQSSSDPGNSGSPYVMRYADQWYVTGLVSNVKTHSHNPKTTWFTKVDFFYDWIADTIFK